MIDQRRVLYTLLSLTLSGLCFSVSKERQVMARLSWNRGRVSAGKLGQTSVLRCVGYLERAQVPKSQRVKMEEG